MLVLCDIRELFAIDLKDKVIASSSGYTKLSVVSMAFKSCRDNKEIIADFTNYFCEGLMLINMQEWRKQNIDSKCIEFLQEYRPEYADQDALNYFVQDAIDLGSNWGVLIYQYITWSFSNPAKIKKEYKHIFDNIKIIHCNGTAKPWTNFYLLADSHIRALVFDNWWDIALHNTFGFTQDFNAIRTQLKQEELSYCMNTILRMINQPDTRIEKMIDNINKRVNNLDSKVWKMRHPHKVFRNLLKKLFSKN